MRMSRLALLALPVAMLSLASVAEAKQRTAPAPLSETDQLNQLSLERARAGQNTPTPGPDTTANLNRLSEQAAQRGQNMNSAPMPFR
jgi:protein CpxP